MKLGRRDSQTASFSDVAGAIPPPTATLDSLIDRFNTKGLSPRDLVALSGIIIHIPSYHVNLYVAFPI